MEPNTTEFKRYLNGHLSNLVWENSKKDQTMFWISLSFLIITSILGIAGLIYYGTISNQVNSQSTTLLFALLIICGIGWITCLILSIIGWTTWRKKRRNNKVALLKKIPNDVYIKYYELVYPNNMLKFLGFYNSQKFPGYNGFVFELNGERIWWDIKEHEEKRTTTTMIDGQVITTTYTVYILQYMIRLMAHRIDNYEPITLVAHSNKGKIKKGQQNPNEFVSSSITFNQKFQVFGSNQLQMTRLFDPSVIDYLDTSNAYPVYLKHDIHIDNGFAYTSWKSGDSRTPWGANLNQFEYLKISREHYIDQITNRISKDFNRFLEIYYLFRPFDFQKVYQQK